MFPKWCSYKYPEISFGAPVPENSEENDINYSTVNCVSGTPVCSGTVKARACVIDNLMEIDQLQKGIYFSKSIISAYLNQTTVSYERKNEYDSNHLD